MRAAIITLEKYKDAYQELDGEEAYKEITETIWKEEVQFAHTLEKGMKEFERIAATGHIEADEAYTLFTTHGFPFEMTMELAKERGLDVDEEGFKREMKKHSMLPANMLPVVKISKLDHVGALGAVSLFLR